MVGTTKRNLLQSKGKYADLTAEMGKISLSMQNVTDCIHAIKETQLNHIGMVDKMETSLQILDDSIVIVITNVMEFFNQLDTLTNIVINQSGAVDNVIQNIAHVSREIGNAENTNTGKRGQDRVSLYATGSELIESSYKLIEKSRQNAVKIGERLKEIDDIAAHINIIAINASIEAAQAGVVGKGFHIISGEIRKFADFTNRFTKDIQNVVNEIKNDTEIAIGTIRTNQTDYNSILNGVAHTTDSLYGAAGNIKTVTEEVKFNYRIIGELLVNLKEKIESLKKNSEYCHVACNDLKEISEDVQEQINSIDLETVEINNNNLNVLRDSNDFEKGLVNVERQISQYNISEE
jgi:methyl-accepting chemotaxis protein